MENQKEKKTQEYIYKYFPELLFLSKKKKEEYKKEPKKIERGKKVSNVIPS